MNATCVTDHSKYPKMMAKNRCYSPKLTRTLRNDHTDTTARNLLIKKHGA